MRFISAMSAHEFVLSQRRMPLRLFDIRFEQAVFPFDLSVDS